MKVNLLLTAIPHKILMQMTMRSMDIESGKKQPTNSIPNYRLSYVVSIKTMLIAHVNQKSKSQYTLY